MRTATIPKRQAPGRFPRIVSASETDGCFFIEQPSVQIHHPQLMDNPRFRYCTSRHPCPQAGQLLKLPVRARGRIQKIQAPTLVDPTTSLFPQYAEDIAALRSPISQYIPGRTTGADQTSPHH
ncbi:hypothetical protein DSO57_1024334 [Entomophthora muscae]|uniref:Uncharacterized protein n=1 Tax=Entomophthora muscae TaxID=34485 RepID=A0ACC2TDG6_9FUNG|nr:hypothetical protein DSO57_1024334 [Entomophthora muscae]